MTSLTEKQIIIIEVLLNISRTKGKKAAKFGQLIKYNMRNIFKVYTQNVLGRQS